MYSHKVPEAFAHLLPVYGQESGVHPMSHKWLQSGRGFLLGYFRFVVREL